MPCWGGGQKPANKQNVCVSILNAISWLWSLRTAMWMFRCSACMNVPEGAYSRDDCLNLRICFMNKMIMVMICMCGWGMLGQTGKQAGKGRGPWERLSEDTGILPGLQPCSSSRLQRCSFPAPPSHFSQEVWLAHSSCIIFLQFIKAKEIPEFKMYLAPRTNLS